MPPRTTKTYEFDARRGGQLAYNAPNPTAYDQPVLEFGDDDEDAGEEPSDVEEAEETDEDDAAE